MENGLGLVVMFLILRFVEDAAGDLDVRNIGLWRRRSEIPRELRMALKRVSEWWNRDTEAVE